MIRARQFTHLTKLTAMIFLLLCSFIANAQLSNYTFVPQTTPVVTTTGTCDPNDFNWNGSPYGVTMDSDVRCTDPYVANSTFSLAQTTTLKIEGNYTVCLAQECAFLTNTMKVYVDGTLIGTAGVTVGPFTINLNLSAGMHTIMYEYDGDVGTAAEISLYYQKLPQVITFPTIAPRIATDGPFSISATGGASGEAVTYSISSGPATMSNNTITLTGAGTVVVEANQAGNSYYLAAPAATQQFTVTKATQTITAPTISNKLVTDGPFDIAFTGGASGSAIVYSIVSGPATISGNTITLTGQAGTVVVEATQVGDNFYADAPSVQRSFDVEQTTAIIKGNSAIAVWPNPCSDRINVSLLQSGKYELINAQGKVMKAGDCASDDELDLSALPVGMYVLKIQSGEQLSTVPLIKQ